MYAVSGRIAAVITVIFISYAAKDSLAISIGVFSPSLIASHFALTDARTSIAKNFAAAIFPS